MMHRWKQFIIIASIAALFATGVFIARAAFKSAYPGEAYVESVESNPSASQPAIVEGNVGVIASPTVQSFVSIESKESEPFVVPQSASVIIPNTATSQPFVSQVTIESQEAQPFFSGGAAVVGANTGDSAQSETIVESVESVSASFLSFLLFKPNLPPNKPVNQVPGNSLDPPVNNSKCEKLAILNPLLSASAFSDPNAGDTHAASEWQVRTDLGNYTTSAFDSGTDAVNKTSITISPNLAFGTRYYWHVKYQDQKGAGSLWSDEWCFTTPLAAPQTVTGVPQNNTGLANPYTILWSWNAVQNADTYIIELKDLRVGDSCAPDGSFCSSLDYVISGRATTYRMDKDYEGKLLSSNALYIIRITAIDSGGKFVDSAYSLNASVNLEVQCPNNGRECRIGEVCFDNDNDGGAATPMICTNFDNCAAQGAAPANQTCYISACPSGIVQPDGSCYNGSPTARIFSDVDSSGVCANKASTYQCDLSAVTPKNPEACKSDGVTGCQSGENITGVSYQPRLKWKDGDPAESFNDYRGQFLSYPGDQMQYEVTVTETAPPLSPTIYASPNSTDLVLGAGADRFLNFANLSVAQYLDFNANYTWQVNVKNAAGALQKTGLVWSFTTESVCPYINHDYNPTQYADTALYPFPNNTPDNPLVMYPTDVTLKWSHTLPLGVLEGPGAGNKPKYELRLQECAVDVNGNFGSCGVFSEAPFAPCVDNAQWSCAPMGAAESFAFGNANPTLNLNRGYRWQITVIHGHTATAPITTICAGDPPDKKGDTHYFLTEITPSIVLKKQLVAKRGAELDYQIDFSFTGASFSRVREFYVRDIYPTNTNIPNITVNPNPASYAVLTAKSPDTLRIKPATAPASLGCQSPGIDHDTGAPLPGGGIQFSTNQITWCLEDTAATNGSISVGAHGTIKFTLKEETSTPLPQCTLLINTAEADAYDSKGTRLGPVTSSPPPVLAGSDSKDLGFVVTEKGDIHSNADICFRNDPSLSGAYIGDYFVTAKGNIANPNSSTPLASRSGTNYVLSADPILEVHRGSTAADFAALDYTSLYSKVTTTVSGECNAANLRAFFRGVAEESGLALNGKVFRCKNGSPGATDYNGDGVKDNGDMVINEKILINDAAGSGTILVDGNLYIQDDIVYAGTAITNVAQVASLGWIVRGSIFIKEYPITKTADCTDASADPRPKKWCDKYQLVQIVDPTPTSVPGDEYPILRLGPQTVGPEKITGTFFAEQKIYTGKINLPLTIQGSMIAGEVVLQRRSLGVDSGASVPSGAGVIDFNNRFAYSELAGWIDMKPVGGGVFVYDDHLDGFAYSELMGWISMKPPGGGVVNNGSGVLSGYGYSDLAGWIRFDPFGGGVIINPSTGEFSGNAYGELVGWIRFSGSGYKVITTWRGQ